MPTILLPRADGTTVRHDVPEPVTWPCHADAPLRTPVHAAARVVGDPLGADGAPDWEATLASRRRLWRHGLGVVEATRAAQRGDGLDAVHLPELVRLGVDAARDHPGARLLAGCGTDAIANAGRTTVADVIDAYVAQAEAFEALGAGLLLLESAELADCARSPDQVALVYDRVLSQVRAPVAVQWPAAALAVHAAIRAGHAGPQAGPDEGAAVFAEVLARNASRVAAVALPAWEPAHEAALRGRLPPAMSVLRTDEPGFARTLVESAGNAGSVGSVDGRDGALLAVLDAVAPAAGAALAAMERGDAAAGRAILAPLEPLARLLFEPPTHAAGAGLAFVAWLDGRQRHFTMPGGRQSARGLLHLVALFRLATDAGVVRDPALACERMRALLAVHGLAG
jgi:hypothetical protein